MSISSQATGVFYNLHSCSIDIGHVQSEACVSCIHCWDCWQPDALEGCSVQQQPQESHGAAVLLCSSDWIYTDVWLPRLPLQECLKQEVNVTATPTLAAVGQCQQQYQQPHAALGSMLMYSCH